MSRGTRGPGAVTMTCAAVEELLEAFVDGELPGGSMRETARHLARCASCERMALRLERVQETVRQAVLEEVAEPDTAAYWRAIVPRLAGGPAPWHERLRGLGERLRIGVLPVPVWVGSAAVAVIVAAILWTSGGQPPDRGRPEFQVFPWQTRIDLLDAPGNVRVWNQPESGALVIWVDEQGMQAAQGMRGVNVESVAQ